MKRFLVVFLALTLLAPLQTLGQTSQQDRPGDPWARVRFLVEDGKVDVATKSGLRLRGTIAFFEWDAITVRDKKNQKHVVLREEVLEIRTVANRKKAIGLAFAGALAGALLGAAAGGGTAGVKEIPRNESGKYVAVGAGIGAAIGAIAGGISGRNRTAPSRVVYSAPANTP